MPARSSCSCRSFNPPSYGRSPADGTSTGRTCCASRTAINATSSCSRRPRKSSPTSRGKEFKSYKQLPINLYHIQTKFRDEVRPRFGVMRSREFIMKDAYSFDADKTAMLKSYQTMYDAYVRIFTRLGLTFRAVSADTGQIGGSASHEFQVLADSGEDAIAYCPASDYAANVELAEALPPPPQARRARERCRKSPRRANRHASRSPSCCGCRCRARSSASCFVPTARCTCCSSAATTR